MIGNVPMFDHIVFLCHRYYVCVRNDHMFPPPHSKQQNFKQPPLGPSFSFFLLSLSFRISL